MQHQYIGSGNRFLIVCFFSITKDGSKVICFALKVFLAWVWGFFAVSYMLGGVVFSLKILRSLFVRRGNSVGIRNNHTWSGLIEFLSALNYCLSFYVMILMSLLFSNRGVFWSNQNLSWCYSRKKRRKISFHVCILLFLKATQWHFFPGHLSSSNMIIYAAM